MSEGTGRDRRHHTRRKVQDFEGRVIRESGYELKAMIVDVSRMGLGITAGQALVAGEKLVLELDSYKIPLLVISSSRDPEIHGNWRYGLLIDDETYDLDIIFHAAGLIELPHDHDSHSKVATSEVDAKPGQRPPRYRVDSNRLRIEAKTIGQSHGWLLGVENVSETGLLISCGSGETPFHVNTILELLIDKDEVFLNEARILMGKVVRTVKASDGGAVFGIQVIDIDDDTLPWWRTFLQSVRTEI